MPLRKTNFSFSNYKQGEFKKLFDNFNILIKWFYYIEHYYICSIKFKCLIAFSIIKQN